MRMVENLRLALEELLAADPGTHLLGEDVVDPYGGAFKVTRGLSTRFPDRVVATPLSEGGIVGVGAGMALAGGTAIVEIMFGDFVALAFDQLVNFASKSVSMYGRRVPMRLLVRCPTGAGRGYGPTHSQSLQKHFLGVPGLAVYEMSPFCDNRTLLPAILDRAEPAIFFEDKRLYAETWCADGVVDELFGYELVTPDTAAVSVPGTDAVDCVVIAPGGVAHRALAAMRELLLDEEINCLLLVPARLYPFDVTPLLPVLARATAICVAEESTPGGTWGSEVAVQLHRLMWTELSRPVALVQSADRVIPTAAHLERDVVLQDSTIRKAIVEALHG